MTTTEFTDQDREDLAPYLEMAALRADNERLAAELAASKAAEASGTGTEEPEPAAPAAPSHEEIQAAVNEIPDNLGPEEFMRQLRAIEARTAPAPPTPPEQLTGEELALAMVAAEQNAGGDKDLYYRELDRIGALDQSAWGSGRRVH